MYTTIVLDSFEYHIAIAVLLFFIYCTVSCAAWTLLNYNRGVFKLGVWAMKHYCYTASILFGLASVAIQTTTGGLLFLGIIGALLFMGWFAQLTISVNKTQ
ncbi:hypothetical protein ACLPJK_26030 [Pseudomonas aeruginosa]|uniref:hypothetical protein n=1 Tax=Pseudomonas aeruginosa TaxID=287 RepID=UPI003D2A4428